MLPLWAVHLNDNVLTPNWQFAGFALLGLLMLAGAWRIHEDDVPSTALLAAAFFVVTLIHVPIPPSKAHLLFNGMLGVILGRRAALAIPCGLLLQAGLLGHGGMLALGVNCCVMTIPALTAGWLFHRLYRHQLSAVLVASSTMLVLLGVAAGLLLLFTTPSAAVDRLTDPLTLGVLGLTAVVVTIVSRRWPVAPEFALGLFLGQFAVLMTLTLQAVALVLGGSFHWEKLAITLFLVHLPIAVVEGVVLGFTIGFLVRVKPQLLRLPAHALPTGDAACSAASAP
jgi:cobalt/nickel transport system permease protein